VALRDLGHSISTNTIGPLLERVGYRRQANRKTREGVSHPDRDAQFEYINANAIAFCRSGDPVISVDTKKKEILGDFKNAGSDYRPKGSPYLVRTHDFMDKELGKAVPYGVYDVNTNTAWVSVGINNDTAEFAVNSIRLWWVKMGLELYPDKRHLMITADGGGSNGSRVKLWKRELQKFADEFGLSVTVCHYPPGTSKWNKIEHRLFCHITQTWRGTPLTDRLAIVELIASTKTEKGLTVRCELDDRFYEKGIQVTEQEFESLYIERADFHPEWNYTIHPRVNGVKPDEAFVFV
jgi:Rhodopirellula transposase DDE domain